MCNVNIANDVGDTALHNAARWGFGELPLVSLCSVSVLPLVSLYSVVCNILCHCVV